MLNYNNWVPGQVNMDLSNYTWIYLAYIEASNEVSDPTIIPVGMLLNAATRYNVHTGGTFITINGTIITSISPNMQVFVC